MVFFEFRKPFLIGFSPCSLPSPRPLTQKKEEAEAAEKCEQESNPSKKCFKPKKRKTPRVCASLRPLRLRCVRFLNTYKSLAQQALNSNKRRKAQLQRA